MNQTLTDLAHLFHCSPSVFLPVPLQAAIGTSPGGFFNAMAIPLDAAQRVTNPQVLAQLQQQHGGARQVEPRRKAAYSFSDLDPPTWWFSFWFPLKHQERLVPSKNTLIFRMGREKFNKVPLYSNARPTQRTPTKLLY